MTLNDQTFIECAAGLAERMMASGESIRDHIEHGFVVATGREPGEREINVLLELADEYEDANRPEAMQAVANVLLNLDEVLMK